MTRIASMTAWARVQSLRVPAVPMKAEGLPGQPR
jgi:hypothetical protein